MLPDVHDTDNDPEPDKENAPDGVQQVQQAEPKPPLQKSKKAPLSKREPDNDYERIEKLYLLNFHALYLYGRISTNTPVLYYGAIGNFEKSAMTIVSVENILAASDNAMADDWIANNTYEIQTIRSSNQLNKILNAKAYFLASLTGSFRHRGDMTYHTKRCSYYNHQIPSLLVSANKYTGYKLTLNQKSVI